MQIQNNASIDPSVVKASVDNQISMAVAVKARQAQIQEGQAAVDLVKQAAEVSKQLSSGRIDVSL